MSKPPAIFPEEPAFTTSAFPPSYEAIVTTAKGVYSWTANGVSEIFRSGSGGIVAAKKICGKDSLLAVADSQVVLLHDACKGMQQSYRLKGTEGDIRLLRYLRDTELLFFTTSLQDAVQSYSLRKARLLESAHTHPSPPTVLAISFNSQFLLSASAAPPTVYLQILSTADAPLLLKPDSSSAVVVAAAFHPERAAILALAFADGTLAVFNAAYLFRAKGKTDRSGELFSAPKLHAVGTDVSPNKDQQEYSTRGYNTGTDVVGIGDRASSIASLAFVPGCDCTSISVGADGKCCLVTFGTRETVVRKWDVGGIPTSLSVIRDISPDFKLQLDGADSTELYHRILVAIGRQDGNVQLFDLDGRLVGKQNFDASGPVLDVEWLEQPHAPENNSRKAAKAVTNPASKTKPSSRVPTVHQSLRLAFADAYALADSACAKPVSLSDKHSGTGGILKEEQHVPEIKVRNESGKTTNSSRRKSEQVCKRKVSSVKPSPPAIPPRPTPRQGGKLALRHAETALAQSPLEDTEVPRNQRKTIATTTVPKDPPTHVPQSEISSGDGTSSAQELKSSAQPFQERTPTFLPASDSTSSLRSPRKMSSIPARLASKYASSASQSLSSPKEASNSTDTIIDWAPASERRTSILHKPSAPPKKRTSAYPLATATRVMTAELSVASSDVIIDWHPPESRFKVHDDLVSPAAISSAAVSRRESDMKHTDRDGAVLIGDGSLNATGKERGGISPLGNGSLNPSLKTRTVSKFQLETANDMKPSRHSSGPKVALSPVLKESKLATKKDDQTSFDLDTLRQCFREELTVVEERILKRFESQKRWFLGSMQERDEWGRKLEEENRLLREELGRERDRKRGMR